MDFIPNSFDYSVPRPALKSIDEQCCNCKAVPQMSKSTINVAEAEVCDPCKTC